MKTLEQYLRDAITAGAAEFRLVATDRGQAVEFYVHPLGKDGDTGDFAVQKNGIMTKAGGIYMDDPDSFDLWGEGAP